MYPQLSPSSGTVLAHLELTTLHIIRGQPSNIQPGQRNDDSIIHHNRRSSDPTLLTLQTTNSDRADSYRSYYKCTRNITNIRFGTKMSQCRALGVSARSSQYLAQRYLSSSTGMARSATSLRYEFDELEEKMSPKVRKLFDLTNGNQREVVKAQKAQGMALFMDRPGNTGDSSAQVIALTTRIQQVQTHLAMHKKDHSGKRGLDRMYVRRRKLLDYMERKDFEAYRVIVKTLGLQR